MSGFGGSRRFSLGGAVGQTPNGTPGLWMSVIRKVISGIASCKTRLAELDFVATLRTPQCSQTPVLSLPKQRNRYMSGVFVLLVPKGGSLYLYVYIYIYIRPWGQCVQRVAAGQSGKSRPETRGTRASPTREASHLSFGSHPSGFYIERLERPESARGPESRAYIESPKNRVQRMRVARMSE